MIGRCGHLLILVLSLLPTVAVAETQVGIYTAVYGDVRVVHAEAREARLVSLRDSVHFRDLISTGAESRTRALLDDDTLLTLGANSRLEITEHVYDPQTSRRSAVLRLLNGTVRALVGKMLGNGSKFEIHTETAIAAARGTYFVVWTDPDGATGIVNIGDEGDVEFRAAGEAVLVRPGQYALTLPGQPPTAPMQIPWAGAPVGAAQRTEVRDNVVDHSPKQTLRSAGGILETDLPRPRLSLQPAAGNREGKNGLGFARPAETSVDATNTPLAGAGLPGSMPGASPASPGAGPMTAGPAASAAGPVGSAAAAPPSAAVSAITGARAGHASPPGLAKGLNK